MQEKWTARVAKLVVTTNNNNINNFDHYLEMQTHLAGLVSFKKFFQVNNKLFCLSVSYFLHYITYLTTPFQFLLPFSPNTSLNGSRIWTSNSNIIIALSSIVYSFPHLSLYPSSSTSSQQWQHPPYFSAISLFLTKGNQLIQIRKEFLRTSIYK